MAEQPINLSAHQVQQLQRDGECEWRRDCASGAPLPHAIGDHLWGREAVYKPRQGESGYRYRADGEQPGCYPQKNYHMPHAACRLSVVVAGAWVEDRDVGLDADQQVHCFTLWRLPHA